MNRDQQSGGLWLAALALGALLNPLMLTGPLFMLQVYDRVIPSGSAPTLVVLFALAAFIYAMMALLDSARGQIMARIAGRLLVSLNRPVFEARLHALIRDPGNSVALGALRDLDRVYRALGSSGMQALLDAPWGFAFFILLFIFHPALGGLALAGGLYLVVLAIWGQWRTRNMVIQAQMAARTADRMAHAIETDAAAVLALGMDEATADKWQNQREEALAATLRAQDRLGVDGANARAFRIMMQSAILALGAWLVLQGELSPGLIIGASILMGRALAPIEQLATQWTELRLAMAAWKRVQRLLAVSANKSTVPLSNRKPAGALVVQGLVVTSSGGGMPILRVNGFEVPPGHALGVIGPSGSGKSTLASAMIGSIPVAAGTLRLGNSVLPIPRPVGCTLGFLPQRGLLLAGSIGENIARFDPTVDAEALERAARGAGIHDMIVAMPQGYGTPAIGPGARLSGGQRQQVGLARALYGDPALVILDEPNAHLDAIGTETLNAAIRGLKARGAVVVIMAHRPAAIAECDDLLVLDGGVQVAFGPREKVLREMVRNSTSIVRTTAKGGA